MRGKTIGILLPALQSAREAARQTTCLNKLKQMGIAFAGYQNESSGYYPNFNWTKGLSPFLGVPDEPIRPVVDSGICPSVPDPLPDTFGNPTTFEKDITYQLVGAFGDYYGEGVFGIFGDFEHRVLAANIRAASNKIVLTESWLNFDQSWWNAGAGDGDWWGVMPNNRGMWNVHQQGSNVLWADGHASLFATDPAHLPGTRANTYYVYDPEFDWTE